MGGKSDSYTDLMKAWFNFNTNIMTQFPSVGFTVGIALLVIGGWIYSKGNSAGHREAMEEMAKKDSNQ